MNAFEFWGTVLFRSVDAIFDEYLTDTAVVLDMMMPLMSEFFLSRIPSLSSAGRKRFLAIMGSEALSNTLRQFSVVFVTAVLSVKIDNDQMQGRPSAAWIVQQLQILQLVPHVDLHHFRILPSSCITRFILRKCLPGFVFRSMMPTPSPEALDTYFKAFAQSPWRVITLKHSVHYTSAFIVEQGIWISTYITAKSPRREVFKRHVVSTVVSVLEVGLGLGLRCVGSSIGRVAVYPVSWFISGNTGAYWGEHLMFGAGSIFAARIITKVATRIYYFIDRFLPMPETTESDDEREKEAERAAFEEERQEYQEAHEWSRMQKDGGQGANFYAVLGVPEKASNDEIKKAYKKLALMYHPDKQARLPPAEKQVAEAKFKEISNAYGVLIDPKRRSAFDAQRRFGGNPPRLPLWLVRGPLPVRVVFAILATVAAAGSTVLLMHLQSYMTFRMATMPGRGMMRLALASVQRG